MLKYQGLPWRGIQLWEAGVWQGWGMRVGSGGADAGHGVVAAELGGGAE
ncbi:hypothetical protein [Muribaculum intestinale]|nr:hypothetical protein [Muribaculum intestinale]